MYNRNRYRNFIPKNLIKTDLLCLIFLNLIMSTVVHMKLASIISEICQKLKDITTKNSGFCTSLIFIYIFVNEINSYVVYNLIIFIHSINPLFFPKNWNPKDIEILPQFKQIIVSQVDTRASIVLAVTVMENYIVRIRTATYFSLFLSYPLWVVN